MFLDYVTIFCKAGDGGDGVVNFHREKYVPNGGPDGAGGGNGGSIYFVADPSLNTLQPFRFVKHYRAESGAKGAGGFSRGKSAEDMYIKVPHGTVVRDAESGGIIADIFDDEPVLILKGGVGGRGNSSFANSARRTPRFAEQGQTTIERKLILELKTIADIGLVGFPNVGKSTLLSIISAARPKIANYHFTTLSPNLGMVSYFDDAFCVADIPGLIEGASGGAGLGHDFLRHIERVRLIAHVVDIAGSEDRDPVEDYRKIRLELKKYSKALAALPEIIILNKCDLLSDNKPIADFKRRIRKKVVTLSAATTQGKDELIKLMAETLKTLPPLAPLQFEKFEFKLADKESFVITRENGIFVVSGGLVEELARKVVLNDFESFAYFQKILREKGVIKALERKGVNEGDTVRILDVEFEFTD